MKQCILFILPAILAFTSCGNKDNPVPDQPFDFSIDLSNKELQFHNIYGLGNTGISIEHTAGEAEPVVVSLLGVPATIDHRFKNKQGVGSFTCTASFFANMAKPGIYPVTAEARSSSGLTKRVTIILNLKSGNCDEYFLAKLNNSDTGVWMYDHSAAQPLANNTGFFFDGFGNNEIFIRNMPLATGYVSTATDTNKHVLFSADCADSTITINKQQIQGYNSSANEYRTYEVYGNGRFDLGAETFYIDYYSRPQSGAATKYTIKGKLKIRW